MAKSDLADSILENAEPDVARELVALTLASEDPEDHRKFLELMAKRRAKDGPSAGATFHFTFDMGAGAITLAEQPKLPAADVVDADDLRLANEPAALPAPEPTPDPVQLELAALLGLTLDEIKPDR